MKNLIFALAFLLLTIPCSAEIIIVDDDWPYDFNNIQAAIDYSSDGDFIFVFPGRYTGPGNRDIDFLGKSVTVRSIVPTDPYIVAETIIDCNGLGRGFYFHSNEDANSVLAGFTITNGKRSSGGGIYCYNSSPTISNCVITGNAVNSNGGGIYCYGSSSPTSSPTITNCTISGNTATNGGGIYCYNYSSTTTSGPTITNCTINGNSANYGGGIYCSSYSSTSSPKVTNCTINGNSAEYDGGGIYCHNSSPKVANCTITGNSAEGDGGGISSWRIFVTSSIVWGNTNISGPSLFAQIDVIYGDVWFSCIQDDNPNDVDVPFGEEQFNIDDDPCFVNPGFRDANGFWHDGDYHLLPVSPCIETGDPYFTYHAGDVDMDAQPRLMGRRVDMGADEFEIAMIVVTKPKGGEVLAAGSTHEINWDSFGITGTVDISYSTNNGGDWIMIDNALDTGSFTWHLPGAV